MPPIEFRPPSSSARKPGPRPPPGERPPTKTGSSAGSHGPKLDWPSRGHVSSQHTPTQLGPTQQFSAQSSATRPVNTQHGLSHIDPNHGGNTTIGISNGSANRSEAHSQRPRYWEADKVLPGSYDMAHTGLTHGSAVQYEASYGRVDYGKYVQSDSLPTGPTRTSVTHSSPDNQEVSHLEGVKTSRYGQSGSLPTISAQNGATYNGPRNYEAPPHGETRPSKYGQGGSLPTSSAQTGATHSTHTYHGAPQEGAGKPGKQEQSASLPNSSAQSGATQGTSTHHEAPQQGAGKPAKQEQSASLPDTSSQPGTSHGTSTHQGPSHEGAGKSAKQEQGASLPNSSAQSGTTHGNSTHQDASHEGGSKTSKQDHSVAPSSATVPDKSNGHEHGSLETLQDFGESLMGLSEAAGITSAAHSDATQAGAAQTGAAQTGAAQTGAAQTCTANGSFGNLEAPHGAINPDKYGQSIAAPNGPAPDKANGYKHSLSEALHKTWHSLMELSEEGEIPEKAFEKFQGAIENAKNEQAKFWMSQHFSPQDDGPFRPSLDDMARLIPRARDELKEENMCAAQDEVLAINDPVALRQLQKNRASEARHKACIENDKRIVAEIFPQLPYNKRFLENLEKQKQEDEWVAVLKMERLSLDGETRYPALLRQKYPNAQNPSQKSPEQPSPSDQSKVLSSAQSTSSGNQSQSPAIVHNRVSDAAQPTVQTIQSLQDDNKQATHTSQPGGVPTGRQERHGISSQAQHAQSLQAPEARPTHQACQRRHTYHPDESYQSDGASNHDAASVAHPPPTQQYFQAQRPPMNRAPVTEAQTTVKTPRPGQPGDPRPLSPQNSWHYCAKSSSQLNDTPVPREIPMPDPTLHMLPPSEPPRAAPAQISTNQPSISVKQAPTYPQTPVVSRDKRGRTQVRLGDDDTASWKSHRFDDSDEWSDYRSSEGSVAHEDDMADSVAPMPGIRKQGTEEILGDHTKSYIEF